MDRIKILAQVGEYPPTVLGTVEVEKDDDGAKVLHATAALLRHIADITDDITTLHEVNTELDRQIS